MAYDVNKLVKLQGLKDLATQVKTELAALSTRIDDIVSTGGEPNVITSVKVNGTALAIAEKAVDILVATGTANGTLAVNGVDVAIKGLAALAYKAQVSQADLDAALQAVLGNITTLVGSDAGKSARTIANEELAAQLIPESAKDSLDTLQEIAAWIQEHPDDASAMNAAIEALQAVTAGIGGEEDDYASVVAAIEGKLAAALATITAGGTNGHLDVNGTDVTVYTHPAHTPRASGLYKITVDAEGHVSAAAAVEKADITGLGIPAQDTTYAPAVAGGANGLLTGADKQKLDGVAEGATKVEASNRGQHQDQRRGDPRRADRDGHRGHGDDRRGLPGRVTQRGGLFAGPPRIFAEGEGRGNADQTRRARRPAAGAAGGKDLCGRADLGPGRGGVRPAGGSGGVQGGEIAEPERGPSGLRLERDRAVHANRAGRGRHRRHERPAGLRPCRERRRGKDARRSLEPHHLL